MFDRRNIDKALHLFCILLGILVFGCFSLARSSSGQQPTSAEAAISPALITFFETKVRPVLVEHCYKCHSADSQELKGGLRLDQRVGWQLGGESGEPAVVPGDPDNSTLVRAIRHGLGAEPMPPNQPRLPDSTIKNLIEWVRIGAPDPREGPMEMPRAATSWESQFRQRLKWWSLEPVLRVEPPTAVNESGFADPIRSWATACLVEKLLFCHSSPIGKRSHRVGDWSWLRESSPAGIRLQPEFL